MEKFSISQSLSFGWRKMLDRFLPLLGFMVLTGVIMYGPGALLGFTCAAMGVKNDNLIQLINMPVSLIFGSMGSMGMLSIMLAYARDRQPGMSDFWEPLPRILNYMAAGLLYGLIVMAGVMLLIVPGIIWGIQFMFYPYCIIEKKAGPIEALKMSSAMTRGAKWALLGYSLLVFLIHIGGVLCLIVGVIPASIVTALATAYIYTELAEKTQASITQGA